MKKVFGMMLIACITLVGCSKAENTQSENTQAANTQAANTQLNANADPAAPPDSFTEAFQGSIKESKSSEAQSNLKAIANGALAYYEAEHFSDDGMSSFSNRFPESQSVQIGPDVNESTLDKKYQVSENDYAPVWKLLYFRLTAPVYYTYSYVSDGKTARVKAAASIFKPCDSIFEVEISSSDSGAVIGPIKDISDTGDCSAAKLP